jgi:hypothetical protein
LRAKAPPPRLLALARDIAEAQINLIRVQHRRNELMLTCGSPENPTGPTMSQQLPRLTATNAAPSPDEKWR